VEATGCFGDVTIDVTIGAAGASGSAGPFSASGKGNVGVKLSSNGGRGCFVGYYGCVGVDFMAALGWMSTVQTLRSQAHDDSRSVSPEVDVEVSASG
jgi:hypothetical protein